MYACNLSWNSIKDTLAHLAVEGCVDEIMETPKKKSYCITAKGRNVIGYYAGLQRLIKVYSARAVNDLFLDARALFYSQTGHV